MIYRFNCDACDVFFEINARPFHPPKAPVCTECGEKTDRVYGCRIDTSGCKDADDIPYDKQVAYGGAGNITGGQAAGIEAVHARHNDRTRRELTDGGNRGTIRKTMQIPAALHAGKIKQTGDPHYWDDPKNRARHNSCKVD